MVIDHNCLSYLAGLTRAPLSIHDLTPSVFVNTLILKVPLITSVCRSHSQSLENNSAAY